MSDRSAFANAYQTLNELRISASEQDTDGFDPTGTSARHETRPGQDLSEHDQSYPTSQRLSSDESNVPSLETEFESVDIDHRETSTFGRDGSTTALEYPGMEALDEPAKLALLKEIFPETKEFTVVHTLRKCNGRIDRAMDELLNHAFFADGEEVNGEGRILSKGVDAFSGGKVKRRGRKKPSNDRSPYREIEADRRTASLPASTQRIENSWQVGRRDVEIISSRTGLPVSTVSSYFHQNSGSIQGTILSLLQAKAPSREVDGSGSLVETKAIDLASDFPSIPHTQRVALVKLTQPSTAAAHELAKLLAARPRTMFGPSHGRAGIEIIPQYSPSAVDSTSSTPSKGLDVDASMASWTQVNGNGTKASSNMPHDHFSTIDPVTRAQTFSMAQNQAFSQASAAARRGRSDRLMMSAAGYYSQVGRDYGMKREEATAEAADALVESQSTYDAVDLHGVGVKDAVRIARWKANGWWRGKGRRAMGVDGRMRLEDGDAGSSSLQIVTGMGKHSRGGRSMIGPAVGRMLASEGWNARLNDGVWTVTGRR